MTRRRAQATRIAAGTFISPCTVHYAARSIDISGSRLMFANPRIPYSIELPDPRLTSYSCLFTGAVM